MTREIALRKFSYAFGTRYLEEFAPRIAQYLVEFGSKVNVEGVVNEYSPDEEPFRSLQFYLEVIHNPFEYLKGPPFTWGSTALSVDFVPLNCWSDLCRGQNPRGVEFGMATCAAITPFEWIDRGKVPPWMSRDSQREADEQLDALATFCYFHFLSGDMEAITTRDLWGRYLLLPEGSLLSHGGSHGGQP